MFVMLEQVGQVINRDDIRRIGTTVDVSVTNEAVLPQSSQDPFSVRTTTSGTAIIFAIMKDNDERLPLKRVPLRSKETTVDLQSWLNGAGKLSDEDRAAVSDRMFKVFNHIQKEENFRAMLAGQQIGARVEHAEGEEAPRLASPFSPQIPSPFTDKDIKNQELRIKKIANIVGSVSDNHTDLEWADAQGYLDEAALAPVLRELDGVTKQLNGAQR